MFQNHAVSICEDSNGNYISLDEAHYICCILNSPIASQYTLQSSDSRSFPIRPRIKIPKFNPTDRVHTEIASLSKEAHENYQTPAIIDRIQVQLDKQYLFLVGFLR